MAHNINTYVGREAAWHQLGTVTGKYNTWAEILAHGGLDFSVFKSQLRDNLNRPVEAWGVFRWDAKDKLARDPSKSVFLGAVGEDYQCMNHASGFEIIDDLMRTSNGAHYETAGVLGKGEVVWGLADLGLAARVGDDVQQGYLLFSTSHDGSHSYTFRICMERVVCENTLNIALGEKSKAVFKIRHTKNAKAKVTEVHEALRLLSDDVKRIEDKLNFLAKRKMNREAFTSIMDRLFPKIRKEEVGEMLEVSSTRRDNILADVLKLYELNDGNAFPEQRGTSYNLLNAITNYVDHERSSKGNGNGRAESALFGSGDKLKVNALDYILEASQSLPVIQESITVDWKDLGIKLN